MGETECGEAMGTPEPQVSGWMTAWTQEEEQVCGEAEVRCGHGECEVPGDVQGPAGHPGCYNPVLSRPGPSCAAPSSQLSIPTRTLFSEP